MLTSTRSEFLACLRDSSTLRTAVCGPACTVVWQGRRGDSPPYADFGNPRPSALIRGSLGFPDYGDHSASSVPLCFKGFGFSRSPSASPRLRGEILLLPRSPDAPEIPQ